MDRTESDPPTQEQIPVLDVGQPVPILFEEPRITEHPDAKFERRKNLQPVATKVEREMFDSGKRSVVNIACKVPGGYRMASGFSVGNGHYIMTVAHELRGVDTAYIQTFDKKQLDAHVVPNTNAVENYADVGILALDGGAFLPPLELGDSQALSANQHVYGLVHPFGLAPLYFSRATYLGRETGLKSKLSEIQEKIASGGALSMEGKNELPQVMSEYNMEKATHRLGWLTRVQLHMKVHHEKGCSGGPMMAFQNGKPKVVGISSEAYRSRTKLGFEETFAGCVPIELGASALEGAKASRFQ